MVPQSLGKQPAAGLLELPSEILGIICKFLIRPTDLKALCLACRSLSQVATARLYRHLNLPYIEGDPDWKWLESLYDNKGLQFVHHIQIGYSDVVCEYGEYNICRPLERLLSSLRHDSLQGLMHGGHGKLGYEQMCSLWRTQKRLTDVHVEINNGVGSWTMDDLRNEGLRELQSLKSVEELSVRLGGSTNLKEYAELQVLMNLNGVQWATIELEPQPIRRNTRITYKKRRLDHDCFSRLLPISLRSITLVLVALPTDKTVQLQDWLNLSELRLFGCTTVAPMLADLRSHKLTTFMCRDHCSSAVERNESGERLCAISSVLSRSKNLETLALDLHFLKSNDLETVAFDQSVQCHKLNLTSLTICPPLFRKFPDAVFKCTELTELSLWVKSDKVVDTCKTILEKLGKISLLNLNLYEQNATRLPEGETQDDPFTSTRLQHLAEEVYQSATSSSVHPIITFSYTAKTPEGEQPPPTKRLSFRPIKNTDLHQDSNGSSTLATPVKDQELPFIFPHSSVLQYR